MTSAPTRPTVNCPVWSRSAGVGPSAVVRPYPVSRRTSPATGGVSPIRTGVTSVIAVPNSTRATSAVSDWRTPTTSLWCPARLPRSVRPTVARVRRATARLTRCPPGSRKQCPAVITQRGAISAPEHQLSRVPPPVAGRSTMVSRTENRYAPSAASSPWAIADAGRTATGATATAVAASTTMTQFVASRSKVSPTCASGSRNCTDAAGPAVGAASAAPLSVLYAAGASLPTVPDTTERPAGDVAGC